jgi:undecaprenyl-diphosphatase
VNGPVDGGRPATATGPDHTADLQVSDARLTARDVRLSTVFASVTTRVRPIPPAVLWFAASLLTWAALLGMVLTREGLAEDDGPLLGWLVQHRGPGWTGAMEAVSSPITATLVPAAALTATLAVGLVARAWRPLVAVVLALGGAAATGLVLKDLVRRARPPVATMLGIPETGWGFPSNHTLITSALAGALVLTAWRATRSPGVRAAATTAGVLAALLMGVSRLYVGDHWLTDVLASYAVAGIVLAAVAWVTRSTAWVRWERAARGALRRPSS